jgi:hypothetical protein
MQNLGEVLARDEGSPHHFGLSKQQVLSYAIFVFDQLKCGFGYCFGAQVLRCQAVFEISE